eukprot:scaffold19910_cov51-Attheya_sp.AAC.6
MGKRGPKGSPRLERAAKRKINNPDLTNEEALLLAGYSKSQSALLSKRNALTKKKKLLLKEEENLTRAKKNATAREKYHLKKENVPLFTLCCDNTSDASSLESKSSSSSSCTAKKKKLTTTSRGSPLVQKPGFISPRSNRTPKQLPVLKKNAYDSDHQKLREKAYGWAMNLVYSEERRLALKGEKDKISLVTIAQMATDRFHLEVSSSTLSSLKAKGASTVQKQGRSPGIVSENELIDVADGVVTDINRDTL